MLGKKAWGTNFTNYSVVGAGTFVPSVQIVRKVKLLAIKIKQRALKIFYFCTVEKILSSTIKKYVHVFPLLQVFFSTNQKQRK